MARTRGVSVGGNLFGYSPISPPDIGFIRRPDITVSTVGRPHIWGKDKHWFTGLHCPM